MAKDFQNLEARVSVLEHQMVVLRRDAAEALALVRLSERNMPHVDGAVRAIEELIGRLRKTQCEHGLQLDAVDAKVAERTTVLSGKIHSRFDEVVALLKQRTGS